jgi:hypothetical protein
VTVSSFTEQAVSVTSGLSEGDRIVVLGAQKLEPGVKVRTVEIR